MITNTMLALVLGSYMSAVLKTNNPVKASMSVLITSTCLFFLMNLNSGMSWFSILFLMLFMGGIIMMFMMLASVLPNEKTLKIKNTMILAAVTMFFLISMSNVFESSSLMMESKTFLSSGLNFYVMMSLILMYFLNSMSVVGMQQAPMRTTTCRYNLIL